MKFKKPYDAQEAAGPVRPLSARERAQQAAIEKSLSKYTELACGHFVTLGTMELFAFCNLEILGKIAVFCEICNDFFFFHEVRSTVKHEYPDNPLF